MVEGWEGGGGMGGWWRDGEGGGGEDGTGMERRGEMDDNTII